MEDDLHRSRLTVFFRLLLAIPLFLWLLIWGIAAFVCVVLMWFAVLFTGRAPEGMHDFIASYLCYSTHVSAYLLLAADPYPWFRGSQGYPIDLVIEPPQRQSRWSAAFRLVLAAPAIVIAAVLGGGIAFGGGPGTTTTTTSGDEYGSWETFSLTGTAAAAAFLAWFAILARGRAPRGLRDLIAYGIGYAAQAYGYLVLLTDRYPNSDPQLAQEFSELPEHPVRIVVADDLVRPRLTVVFRLLLAIPHFVWLILWFVAAFFAVIAAWFATLVTGRTPSALHRFLAAFVRYSTHVMGFVYLVGRRFPGFTGRAGSYGIDIEIAPPEQQNRWKTLFRLFLAIPAFIVSGALDGVAVVVAFFAWWYAVVTGRMPEGLRNLGAACLRYSAQTSAYVLLLTDRYPYGAPVLEGRRPVEETDEQAYPPPPPPSTPPPPPTPMPASGDAF
jgi:Domain of unknown function (DUF4389)